MGCIRHISYKTRVLESTENVFYAILTVMMWYISDLIYKKLCINNVVCDSVLDEKVYMILAFILVH
jgi:hypothetical protein